MKTVLLSVSMLFTFLMNGFTQTGNLPLKEWNAITSYPFVLYISGDGGLNSFSTDLCTTINKAGYSITALNAKSYFWDKKTPEQAASDIAGYLNKQFKRRPDQQLVLAGYSFGADVMPFIVNRLPDSVQKRLVSVVLLSPSTSTDFEVHWTDIFGGNKKRSMDVVAAINNMYPVKTTTIFGDDEDDFPVKDIKLKNYTNKVLPGGHHFDGNTGEVAKTMLSYFK